MARELDLVLVRGHLELGAPVEQERDVRAEPFRLDRDVDRGVAAADDGDAAAHGGRLARLQLLDERQRLPDALEVVALVGDVDVGAQTHGEHDRVDLRFQLLQPRLVDALAEPELDAHVLEQPRLVRQRLVRLAVGRDRVADEATDLLALVVNGDRVAVGRRAHRLRPGPPGRRRSPPPASRSAAPAGAAGRRARRPTRSRSAGARRSRSAAGPRGRGRSRAGRASRPGRRARRSRRGCSRRRSSTAAVAGSQAAIAATKPRHVDVRRAGRHARRLGVGAAALEAAVRLDHSRLRGERRAELPVQLFGAHTHAVSVSAGRTAGIGVGTEATCGKAAPSSARTADVRTPPWL